MRKQKTSIAILLTLILTCCVFAACDYSTPTATTCTVTFDAQNGTDTITVSFDENFAYPDTPTREGYTFGGWYTDKTCTDGNEWVKPDKLAKNITVYAKWTEKQNEDGIFYIIFDFQNGSATKAIAFDENFALPDNPTKSNYEFGGWYTDKSCTDDNEWTVPEALTEDITVYAKWNAHVHDFGDNYLMFVECSGESCNVIGRNSSTDSAKANFVYSFNSEKQQKITQHYQNLIDNLGTIAEAEYEELFETYDSDVSYVVEQYQYAYVFYNVNFDQSSTENFDTISNFYNECIANYYGLFRKVYESDYRDEFFAGWSQNELDQILTMSDSYGNSQYTEVQNKISELIIEYNELMEKSSTTSKQITSKYKELVTLNNQLAALSGYENYLEYAYEIEYERDYTPSDVETMRNFVKQYIGPSLDNAISTYSMAYYKIQASSQLNSANLDYYDAFGASVFNEGSSSQTVTNLLGNYFKQLTSDESSTTVDFYKYANELMKNGNYYLGEQSGAFTYWISNQNTSILYFSNETDAYGASSYQNVFTFAHEFGHYYNGIYNGGTSLSMDLNETQSQGDEMLFLAWLSQNKPSGVTTGYTLLQYEQLANMLSTIVIATAVDEFEQAVYTDSYNNASVEATYTDYETLFAKILHSYCDYFSDGYNDEYWSYVVFDNAGYYISYAMSALPCVELHVIAMSDYASAKTSYLKLFTFTDDSTLISTDSEGNKTVNATYEEILNYCGLSGPFRKDLYTTVYNYFK